jgi:hypothetical protein
VAYRRNEVLEAMVEKIKAVQKGDDYNFSHRFVTRDPMGNENVGKLNYGESCVGIYDVAEEKQRNFGSTNATLTVIVEFYYKPFVNGDSKSEKLNLLLAEITKALMVDQTLDNTSLKLEDVENNLDIDGIYDKIVNGSITFKVIYRHGLFDPTKAIC